VWQRAGLGGNLLGQLMYYDKRGVWDMLGGNLWTTSFGVFLRGVFWDCRRELEEHMYVDYVKEQNVECIV
jgi:hypothetical protein